MSVEEIAQELEKLRESDTVRVIDALAVHKDAEGEIEVQHLSNLTKEEAIELGSKVAVLVGLGIEARKAGTSPPRSAPRTPRRMESRCSTTRSSGKSSGRSRTTRPQP